MNYAKKLLLLFSCGYILGDCCYTPRDVSTDSMLELALVNYHRYHALEKHMASVYLKPFFIGARYQQQNIAGLLFTGYANVTNSIWLGLNTAAMSKKINNIHTGGLDDIQFKLAYDLITLEETHATGYLVATAPTGKKYCGCPLEQPTVGSRNGRLGLGINLDAIVGDIGDYSFSWLFDLKYLHTFRPHTYYTPRNTIDVWTALNFPIYQANLELGYDFWWQKSITHTISATQKLYADLGYTFKQECYAALFGLGAAYEFSPKNALERWTVWLTTGIVF